MSSRLASPIATRLNQLLSKSVTRTRRLESSRQELTNEPVPAEVLVQESQLPQRGLEFVGHGLRPIHQLGFELVKQAFHGILWDEKKARLSHSFERGEACRIETLGKTKK